MKKFHENCFACGKRSVDGLKLRFGQLDDGTLCSEFKINKKYQGYNNRSHGGIVATVLVSSMINLFYLKYGMKLKTVRLNVRYKKPLPIEANIKIRAVERDNLRDFYKAKSQIMIDDKVVAEAEGYFKEQI